MRNDTRPLGGETPDSPLGHEPSGTDKPSDSRASVTHDRQSPVVHEEAERRETGNTPEDGELSRDSTTPMKP
jgi:hypothetical protein